MPIPLTPTAATAIGLLLGHLYRRATVRHLRARNTELRRTTMDLEDRLRSATHLADHDWLTGLPNRAAAARTFHLDTVIRRRLTTVVLADLDRLKTINDRYGHRAGDELIRTTATRLARAAHHHHGYAARLAGDEFLLLLPTPPAENPDATVTAVLAPTSDPLPLHTDDGVIVVHPSISAGIAVHHGNTTTFTTMLHHADIALYQAKQHRGSRHRYQPHLRIPHPTGSREPRRRDRTPDHGETAA